MKLKQQRKKVTPCRLVHCIPIDIKPHPGLLLSDLIVVIVIDFLVISVLLLLLNNSRIAKSGFLSSTYYSLRWWGSLGAKTNKKHLILILTSSLSVLHF
jgi:hypothetical protein